MLLTKEQLDVLNHICVDGQAWADHVEKTFTPEKANKAMLAKVATHKPSYEKELVKGNYLNRKQREDEQVRLEKERYDNASWDIKRQREYPSIKELVVALYDEDDKADIQKRRAEVKAKYPKE